MEILSYNTIIINCFSQSHLSFSFETYLHVWSLVSCWDLCSIFTTLKNILKCFEVQLMNLCCDCDSSKSPFDNLNQRWLMFQYQNIREGNIAHIQTIQIRNCWLMNVYITSICLTNFHPHFSCFFSFSSLSLVISSIYPGSVFSSSMFNSYFRF